MVLWSLRRASRCYEAFRSCDHFVINVLAQDQLAIANQFSRACDDRFAGVSWSPSPNSGLPVIDGVSAWFDCRTANAYDAGDHTIFLGEVLGFSHAERAPLVFHAGAYLRTPDSVAS
jgi:3-hydroxy-9,10-secoandrosta-1,3,5(10)-triene-9,17-dione monooxygenase reductase component